MYTPLRLRHDSPLPNLSTYFMDDLLFELDFFKYCKVLSLETKKNLKKMQTTAKLLDIARDRRKTLKKETQFILLYLYFSFFIWQVIANAVIKHHIDMYSYISHSIQIYNGFVDAVLRRKILGNRLGILTYNLIAFDYYY